MPNRLRSVAVCVLILVAVYVCFFSRLDAIGLVGPDEPRYAAIAGEMAQSGDWVTPRLNGRPWFEKPVLNYWLAGISFRWFGVNEISARLPSAVCATLALLALAWLAGKLNGVDAASLTFLLGCTTAGFIGFAHAATTDMPFSAALVFSMVLACRILWPEKFSPVHTCAPRWTLLAFGAGLGLATLAKGPVALVLAGGGSLLWAASTKRWKAAFRLGHPLAVAAWAGVTLPWYLLCAWRNPEFVQVFLISHNLERFFTPVFQHEQPVWFFGPILLLGMVPWSLPLAVAAGSGARLVRRMEARNTPEFFLTCWAVFIVLFFSVSRSKLPGYILPALFPLSWLLAAWLAGRLGSPDRQTSAALTGAGMTFSLLAASAHVWLKRLPDGASELPSSEMLALLIALSALGLVVAALGIFRRHRLALLGCVLLATGVVATLNIRILPRLDAQLSPRAAARTMAGKEVLGFRLHRAWQFGLNFYLGRELRTWNPDAQASATVLTSRQGVEEVRAMGRRVDVLSSFSSRAVLIYVSGND
jgi:4-amino-4-deoxy-L-arabinose transferase-like glycosyltransferase